MEPNDITAEALQAIKAAQKQINELFDQNRRSLQPVIEMFAQINDRLQPLFAAASEITNRYKEIATHIKIPDSLRVISMMKQSQYVFWDYLTRSFIDNSLNCLDFNMVLSSYESEDDYSSSEVIITKCKEHDFLKPCSVLYSQSVDAYKKGMYYIAAMGLTAIIDSTLSEATRNPTHQWRDRCNTVLDKLIDNEHVAEEEYASLSLFMTFNAMAESFYKTIPFSEFEPNDLNRNWIMHGRSQREYTRLDCIKLFRFLYGILLICDIEEQGIREDTVK